MCVIVPESVPSPATLKVPVNCISVLPEKALIIDTVPVLLIGEKLPVTPRLKFGALVLIWLMVCEPSEMTVGLGGVPLPVNDMVPESKKFWLPGKFRLSVLTVKLLGKLLKLPETDPVPPLKLKVALKSSPEVTVNGPARNWSSCVLT